MRHLRLWPAHTSLGVALSVALSATLAASTAAVAQQTDSTRPRSAIDTMAMSALIAPPLLFKGYSLAFTEQYTDPLAGTMYRFTRKDSPWVDIFVYPYPDSADLRSPDAALMAARAAADDFVVSLPVMRQQNIVDDYRVAISGPDSIKLANGWIRGDQVGVAIKRRGGVFASLFYIYAFPAELIKVRMELPSTDWQRSDVPGWARGLVEEMYGHPEHRALPGAGYAVPARVDMYSLYTIGRVQDSTTIYYRYVAPRAADVRVTVRRFTGDTTIAPGPATDSADATKAAAVAQSYLAAVTTGNRPLLPGYRADYAHADTAALMGATKIGYTTVGSYSCRGMTCVDIYYAYVIGNHVVSVSTRLAQSIANTSDIPTFTHSLIGSLSGHSFRGNPAHT